MAFQAVQRAESLGASSDRVASLCTQLNTALAYYNKAADLSAEGNSTGAQYYATLSNNTSSAVLDQAIVLQQQAEADKTTQQALAYLLAIAASVFSSLLLFEYHRIPNLVRKRRLDKARIKLVESDESKN